MNRTSFHTALLLTFLASGCVWETQKPAPPKVIAEDSYLVHIVSTRGETLGKIAKWYAGSYDARKEIAASNDPSVSKQLKSGDRVLIPLSLVKNSQPYNAKGVVEKSVTKTSKKGSTPAAKEVKAPSNEKTPAEEPKAPPVNPEKEQEAKEPIVEQPNVEPSKGEVTTLPQSAPSPDATPEREVITHPQHPIRREAEAKKVEAPPKQESADPTKKEPAAGEKSIDDILREEQAQLERLQQELKPAGASGQ